MHRFLRLIPALFILFLCVTQAQTAELQEAYTRYKAGNFLGAGEIFEKIINTTKASKDVYFAAIDCFLQTNSYNKAIKYLEKLHSVHGAEYKSKSILAKLYNETGRYTSAVQLFGELVKQYPDSPKIKVDASLANTNAGIQAFQANKNESAVSYLKAALAFNSNNLDAKKVLTMVYLKTGKYKEGLPLAEALYKADKKNEVYRDLYIDALANNDKLDKALEVAETAAKANPHNLQLQMQVALLLRYNLKQEEALLKYRELRKENPKEKAIYRAEAELIRLSFEKDSLVGLYKDYLVLVPNDTEFMLALGKAYERIKKYPEAREVYGELKMKNLDSSARLYIADVFLMEKNYKSAIQELTEYVNNSPRQSEPFILLASLLRKDTANTEAGYYLNKGLQIFPGNLDLTVDLAKLYYFTGKYDSCFTLLQEVKQRHSEQPAIAFYLALLSEKQNKPEIAIANYRRAIMSSLQRTEIIQAEVMGSVSGNNAFNPDSMEKAEKRAVEYDSISAVMKTSFARLKALNSSADYISILSEMIKKLPAAALLYIRRADEYADAGNNSLAARDIQMALTLSPAAEEVQSAAGSYYERTGENQKAFDAFTKAISLNKKVALYYRKSIDIAEKLGNLKELGSYWLQLWNADKYNDILREAVLEVLHKTNRSEEAARVVKESQEK